MKGKKYYLVLAALTAICCATLSQAAELPHSGPQTGLLANANPTLAEITQLYVVILPPDTEPNKDGLVWKELKAKVENRLEQAGIQIAPETRSGYKIISLEVPELRVYVDMLKLTNSHQYVFHIHTAIGRKAYLAKQVLKPNVWQQRPTMEAVSPADMPAKVTAVVLAQTEGFVHAYLAAKRSTARLADANSVSAIPGRQTGRHITSAAAKYEFVASKGSRVFHRPDCAWSKESSRPISSVTTAVKRQ